MIYIADFDYTLFNTGALLDRLVREFERFGIAAEQFHSAVQQVKQEVGYYDYKKHVAQLAFGQDYKAALEVMESVVSQASEFLYPDTLPFLERAHAANHQIYILTFGDDDWQRKKIIGAQIDGFVQTHTTIGSKVDSLKALGAHGQPMIMVEDSGPIIDDVKTAFPDITTVWMRRPNGKYRNDPCTTADHEVQDLSGLPFTIFSV